MRRLVRAKEMKEIDRRTIEYYKIPSMVLMERAALAVATEARRILEETGCRQGMAACAGQKDGPEPQSRRSCGLSAAREITAQTGLQQRESCICGDIGL